MSRSPVASPAVTRSRSTDKEPTDKELKRTLSDTGIGNEISPQVTAAIELAVNKAISSQRLVADISARVSEIVISNLTTALTAANNRIDQLMSEQRALDYLAQYQRRNSLRLFGVRFGSGCQVDRVPQLGAEAHRRPRPVLVKFTSYRQRREVYSNKKKFKGTKITIREDLTAARMETFKRATENVGPRSVWTLDGRGF
ncbi:hypothetical protein J6590_032460 [Homalodisca vitripennis]|nr:hypothetical protein J6590_032460 [Homalodisca vitripennis]